MVKPKLTSTKEIIPLGPAIILLEFISSSNRIGSTSPSFADELPPSTTFAHRPVNTVSYLSLSLREEKAAFNRL
jgi:hypothetical protein